MKLARKAAIVGLAALGGLFALGAGSHAVAATSDALTITLRVLDTTPPAPITDLSASPGGVGQALLQWTAPDEDNNIYTDRNPATSYTVRLATFSADSVGGSAIWWSMAQDISGEPPPSNPSVNDFMLINGLSGGVTYYFGIKSTDEMTLLSPIDIKTNTVGQQARAFVTSALSIPSNFSGLAISTISINWTWDLTASATFYRLSTYPADTPVAQTTNLSLIESGFSPNLAVQRVLRAGNGTGVSLPTSPITVYTLAQIPNNVIITGSGLHNISLSWSANTNPAGTQYRLERSIDGISYTPVITQTGLAYADTGLSELTSYYYRVRGINGDGLLSSPSTPIIGYTSNPPDTLAPMAPAGLKGFLDGTGSAFTLSWEAVTFNRNGTAVTDLAGYYIYRRSQLTGAATRVTPVPITTTAFADQVNNQTYYYTIRAVDTGGNESDDSLIADSSIDANIIYLSTDGITQVRIPQTVNDLLRSAYNKYRVPLTIDFVEDPLPNDSSIVRNVRLRLVRIDTHEVLNDIAFSRPLATVAVGYNVLNGEVARGAPSVNGLGGARSAAVTPDQLSLYWFNGVTWVSVGGTLDVGIQAVKTKSSFLGNYQLRSRASPTKLNLSAGNVYPRLFTPNGDGLNDRAYFVLQNPNGVSVTGEVIDKEGRHVRTLPPPVSGIGTTLTWDGKDDRGNVVPGGVYIYKISGEGQTFTGTVGVAR